ncbi:MAG TPA: hypothetical protein VE199_02985 [Nitrososphaera sp.]|nr:hypothetical protein [Nitrososphaera sp.]
MAAQEIIAFWAFAKRHRTILIVGIAFIVDQVAKIILEGLLHPHLAV